MNEYEIMKSHFLESSNTHFALKSAIHDFEKLTQGQAIFNAKILLALMKLRENNFDNNRYEDLRKEIQKLRVLIAGGN